MKLLTELSVPMMVYRTKNKNLLATINNYASMHFMVKSKLKNQYKELLKEWFLDTGKLPKTLHFDVQPIYKDRRRRDAINTSPSLKVLEDCLVELCVLEDDDDTEWFIRHKQIDTTMNEHKFVIKIYDYTLGGDNV